MKATHTTPPPRRTRRSRVLSVAATGLALLVALLAGAPSPAEVAATGIELPATGSLIMAIGEHPDPVGSVAWKPVSGDLGFAVLNPGGFERGDGTPDIEALPSGRTAVVWPYNRGTDFDVAYSEWTGSEWTPPMFLADTLSDEKDPRIAVGPEGNVYVVWWTEGNSGGIRFAKRSSDGDGWSDFVTVSGSEETARRPSIAVLEGRVIVAYERDAQQPGYAQEVVVAEQGADSAFGYTVIAETTRTARLDPMLHCRAPHLWLDWKHEEGLFGLAISEDGGWSGWSVSAWSDSSWVGVENQRRRLRSLVTVRND